MGFAQTLETGINNEIALSTYLENQGCIIYRVFDVTAASKNQGHSVIIDNERVPVPDIYYADKDIYIEAKYRTGWTYYRNKSQWQIGLNKKEIYNCKKFMSYINKDVKLWITIVNNKAEDSRWVKHNHNFGTGVFELDHMNTEPDHIFDGVFYYNAVDLKKIINLGELYNT